MTRLDLALAVLVGLSLVIAGGLTWHGTGVPDLVEYAGFTCLGSIARGHVHRVRRARTEKGNNTT